MYVCIPYMDPMGYTSISWINRTTGTNISLFKGHFSQWCSFSPGKMCDRSLEGISTFPGVGRSDNFKGKLWKNGTIISIPIHAWYIYLQQTVPAQFVSELTGKLYLKKHINVRHFPFQQMCISRWTSDNFKGNVWTPNNMYIYVCVN